MYTQAMDLPGAPNAVAATAEEAASPHCYSCRLAQQNRVKPRLTEMRISAQRGGDGAFTHECERHAIGQAPALVFAGAQQFKRGLEQRFREGGHFDLGIAVHLLRQLDRDAAPGKLRQCGTELKLHRARSDEENVF